MTGALEVAAGLSGHWATLLCLGLGGFAICAVVWLILCSHLRREPPQWLLRTDFDRVYRAVYLAVAILKTAECGCWVLLHDGGNAGGSAFGAALFWFLWWRAGGGKNLRRRLRTLAAQVRVLGSKLVAVPLPQPA